MIHALNARCLLGFGLLIATSVYADTPREHPAADPANPPQGRFSDYWMVIMLAGEKMGYVHAEQERAGDEIRTRMHTHVSVKRAAVALEITMKTSSTESITGEPLAFSIEENFAQVPVRRRGTIRDGMITVEAEQFGNKTTQQIAYPAGALMEWGLHLETLKYKAEPGTVITVDAFVPGHALNVGIPSTTEILERGEVDVLGQRVSALKTKTTTVINGVDIEAIGWVDDELTPIRQVMEIMGLKFELIRCDMAMALKDVTPAEVFVSTLIPVNRPIDRAGTQSVTYTFSGIDDAMVPDR